VNTFLGLYNYWVVIILMMTGFYIVIAQGNLIWDVATGPLAHKLLLGVEYGSQKTANQRFNRVFMPSNIFSLTTRVFPAVTFTSLLRDTQSDVRFFSAYAQDQISIGRDPGDLVLDVVDGVEPEVDAEAHRQLARDAPVVHRGAERCDQARDPLDAPLEVGHGPGLLAPHRGRVHGRGP